MDVEIEGGIKDNIQFSGLGSLEREVSMKEQDRRKMEGGKN